MEWTEKILAKISQQVGQDALRTAAISVLPTMRVRIFEKGLTPEGVPIGFYSRRPLFIENKDLASQVGGQPRPGGRFYPGGYAEYKKARGSKGFDLRNFGIMMRDFLAPRETLSENRIVLELKEARNKEIAAKYPQAFGMSKEEKEIVTKVFVFELEKRLFQ